MADLCGHFSLCVRGVHLQAGNSQGDDLDFESCGYWDYELRFVGEGC